jgi:hypothetical protein
MKRQSKIQVATKKIQDQANLATKKIQDQANLLRSKFRKVVTGDEKKRIRDRIRETQEEPKYVKFFDKVAFTAGVMNMGICQYFLLNRPDVFPLWYALVVPVMLISRYIYFHGAGWQYFMIDFCCRLIACVLVCVRICVRICVCIDSSCCSSTYSCRLHALQ